MEPFQILSERAEMYIFVQVGINGLTKSLVLFNFYIIPYSGVLSKQNSHVSGWKV